MDKLKFRAWDDRNKEYVFSSKEESFYINTKGVLFMYGFPGKPCTEFYKSYRVDIFSGLSDSNGVDIYENDIVYIAGYGEYTAAFPFTELYEAGAEGDVGAICGSVH